MSLFNLMASLTLNKDDYDKGLTDAEKSASGFGNKLKSGLGTAAKVGAAAIGAMAAGVAAVGTAFVKSTAETAAYGDQIDKMSQKLGLSAEAYQEWDFILQHSGTSIEALKPAIKTLASAAESGSEAFEQLGLSQEQIASMSAEDLFSATIKALQGVEDESKRTAIANKLLGKSGMELGALLNTTAEDTEAMRQQVHELGGVMSDEAVKSAAAYQDALQNFHTAVDGIKRGFIEDFMPSVTSVMDGLTLIFSGDNEAGLGAISAGIDSMAATLTEKLPVFAEIAVNIIESIGTAIIDNLPTIIDSASTIVLNLATALVNNLPKIVQAAVTIITKLAQNLSSQMPILLPAIIDCIVIVAKTLVENAPLLIKAGFELFVSIIKSLPEIIVKLVSAVGEILNSIFVAIKNGFTEMVQIGGNLIKGLWQGIGDKAAWLWEQVKGWCSQLWGKIKNFFGIHSPSSLFREGIGKNLMLGLGDGITKYGEYAVDAMEDVTDDILESAEMSPDFSGSWESVKSGAKVATANGQYQIVQNIYAYEMSPAEAFEAADQQAQTAAFLGLA